eukprot:TRINITY_DN6929_c0_g2_i6.p1 TRINITY_DN6929_c0_g2~~TRINITY_DN6929_c0_g2_i6.p1  ORF type:complete len:527 (-),score=90.35 TRINITY_DN6929_c0_g2_i6:65-1645(-)
MLSVTSLYRLLPPGKFRFSTLTRLGQSWPLARRELIQVDWRRTDKLYSAESAKKKGFPLSVFLGLLLALSSTRESECEQTEQVDDNDNKPQEGPNTEQVEYNNNNDPQEGTNKETDEDSIPFDLVADVWKSECRTFILAAISALLASVIGIRLQLILGEIIDLVKASTPLYQIKSTILKFFGLVIVETFLTYGYYSLISDGTERMSSKLRRDIFKSILNMDIAFFDATKTGDIVLLLDSKINEFRRAFKYLITDGLKYGTQIVGGVCGLYMLSPHLTMVTLLVVPVLVGIGSLYAGHLRSLSKQMHETQANTFSFAYERVQNIRTVRSFGVEDDEIERFKNSDSLQESAAMSFGNALAVFRGISFLAVNGLAAGLLGYGASLISDGKLTTGDLTSFLVTALNFQKAVGQMSVLFGKLTTGMNALQGISRIRYNEPEIPLHGGSVLPHIDGNLEFHSVSFSYPLRPDQQVFCNLSLSIPEGQVIALVGPSGSGKSTFVSLLERCPSLFFFPDQPFLLPPSYFYHLHN